MNPPTEFDRVLGEWLLDGPNRAPEHVMETALEHAHRHPRRRDLLAPFRSDVMPSRRGFMFMPRLGLVFAAFALLVAGIAVAVVGSRLSNDRVVPPGPTQPTTAPSIGPSVLPSVQPSASASPSPFVADVQLELTAGQPQTVRVSDATGELVEATSGSPAEGVSVETGVAKIAADPADDHVLVVTWSGGPCETSAEMRVDDVARVIHLFPGPCEGDAIALDRVIRLRFSNPVTAGGWTGMVQAGPTVTPRSS